MYIGEESSEGTQRSESLCSDSSFTSRQQAMYIQKQSAEVYAKLLIKATLVTDPSKAILVEVQSHDTVSHLQLLIQESVQDNFELFKGLQLVRVFNLTRKRGKRMELPTEGLVGDYLIDGEEIYFRLESLNFWLKVEYRLYHANQAAVVTEGNIEMRVDKNERITNLKKKLQVLMIQLWSAFLQKDTFYTIDKLEIDSLRPPQEDSALDLSQYHSQLEDSSRNPHSDCRVNGSSRSALAKLTDKQYASQWFDFSNQVEVVVIFAPFMLCKILTRETSGFMNKSIDDVDYREYHDHGQNFADHSDDEYHINPMPRAQIQKSFTQTDRWLPFEESKHKKSTKTLLSYRSEGANNYELEVFSNIAFQNVIVNNTAYQEHYDEFVLMVWDKSRKLKKPKKSWNRGDEEEQLGEILMSFEIDKHSSDSISLSQSKHQPDKRIDTVKFANLPQIQKWMQESNDPLPPQLRIKPYVISLQDAESHANFLTRNFQQLNYKQIKRLRDRGLSVYSEAEIQLEEPIQPDKTEKRLAILRDRVNSLQIWDYFCISIGLFGMIGLVFALIYWYSEMIPFK